MTLFEVGDSSADPGAIVRHLSEIIDSGADAFIGMDRDGRIIGWNRAAATLFGWDSAEALGRTVAELIIPARLRETHAQAVARLLATRRPTVLGTAQEVPALHRDGTEIPVEITRWQLETERGTVFYAFLRDIRQRKEAEFIASHDRLTGLLNRSAMIAHMERHLTDPAGRAAGCALTLIDIDQFQRVNDLVGESGGDEVLRMIAERIAAASAAEDVVARLSGDQFAVVSDSAVGTVELGRRMAALADALARPIAIAGRIVELDVSMGAAQIDMDTAERFTGTIETLWREAETALRRAALVGGTRFDIYDASLRRQAAERRRTSDALRDALDRGELELYYQPIVAATGGALFGVEALARWHHPTRGLIAPGEFIPLAEEFGLMQQLGDWAIRQVLAQIADWRERRVAGAPRISVNLSPTQLTAPGLIDQLFLSAAEQGVDLAAGSLCIEVTEEVFIDEPESAAAALRRLRDQGVRVALDDFGTGFSSMAYLKNLPVDELKIDRSFVSGLPGDRADYAIAGATVQLARALDLDVVAEGVETQAQWDSAVSLGCTAIQGFLMGRPEPIGVLDARLVGGS